MVICWPVVSILFFLMIRRPPRSTLDRSSAASDVYKRQVKKLDGSRDQVSYGFGADSQFDLPAGDYVALVEICLLYTSPSPRDRTRSRMPSSA